MAVDDIRAMSDALVMTTAGRKGEMIEEVHATTIVAHRVIVAHVETMTTAASWP